MPRRSRGSIPTSEQREPEQGLMVALRSMRSQERLWLKDRACWGPTCGGKSRLARRTCVDGLYRLCTGATTTVLIDALVGVGPTL